MTAEQLAAMQLKHSEQKLFSGNFHAMFWAAGTLATQADHMPRHWIARIVAVLWMFTAEGVGSFYYGPLPASLAAQPITGDVNGPPARVCRPVGPAPALTARACPERH